MISISRLMIGDVVGYELELELCGDMLIGIRRAPWWHKLLVAYSRRLA